jgi:hypothetical protein
MNMSTKALKRAVLTSLPVATLALAGCWTPPNANVQPKGQPGLIQKGIVVESIKSPATVRAIDGGLRTVFGGIPTFKDTGAGAAPAEPGQRTITLGLPDGKSITYPVAAKIKKAAAVKVSDRVKITLSEDLAVYRLEQGRLPGAGDAESLGINARVQLVDPSYRLLTLQYPNGQTETFKVGLDARLQQMAPGDSVVARAIEVTAIHIEKP